MMRQQPSAYLAVQPFQDVTASTTGKVQQPPSITGKPAAMLCMSDSNMLLLYAAWQRLSPIRGADSCCRSSGDGSMCLPCSKLDS